MLEKDEILPMTTDGVTEACGTRPEREFFGYDGLVKAARFAAGLPVLEAMEENILQPAHDFTADGGPQEDICLRIARREKAGTRQSAFCWTVPATEWTGRHRNATKRASAPVRWSARPF